MSQSKILISKGKEACKGRECDTVRRERLTFLGKRETFKISSCRGRKRVFDSVYIRKVEGK